MAADTPEISGIATDWPANPMTMAKRFVPAYSGVCREINVQVTVAEVGLNEFIGAPPGRVRTHLAAIPSRKVNELVVGQVGQLAADGFFRNTVKGGDTPGIEIGRASCRGRG